MSDGGEILRSQLGVRFTKRSTWTMQDFRNSVRQEGAEALMYSVARLEDGSLTVVLCADFQAVPAAIRDQVGNIEFYWYTSPDLLEALSAFVVDSPGDEATKLLPG